MAAAFPDLGGMSMQDHMGGSRFSKLMLDRLEWQEAGDAGALAWEGNASWGSEMNRLWFSSEGEREDGKVEHLDNRFYGSHAFARWWEATAGLRQLGGEGPDRTFAGIGVQGLAPYFFELSASAWVGEGGRSALTMDAEYEVLLSNRLILQPRLEMNAWGKSDVEKGTGKGLSDAALGLRLRYEIRREFAPYIGLEWSGKFGETADLSGDDRTSDFRVLAGIRLWL
ncbi:MAG: copper resistance protein B [Moraxellaceae bacterium]